MSDLEYLCPNCNKEWGPKSLATGMRCPTCLHRVGPHPQALYRETVLQGVEIGELKDEITSLRSALTASESRVKELEAEGPCEFCKGADGIVPVCAPCWNKAQARVKELEKTLDNARGRIVFLEDFLTSSNDELQRSQRLARRAWRERGLRRSAESRARAAEEELQLLRVTYDSLNRASAENLDKIKALEQKLVASEKDATDAQKANRIWGEKVKALEQERAAVEKYAKPFNLHVVENGELVPKTVFQILSHQDERIESLTEENRALREALADTLKNCCDHNGSRHYAEYSALLSTPPSSHLAAAEQKERVVEAAEKLRAAEYAVDNCIDYQREMKMSEYVNARNEFREALIALSALRSAREESE